MEGEGVLKKIVTNFTNAIDYDKEYTLDELKKTLSEAFKSVKTKKSNQEKRPPSEYNLFIKERMAKLKAEPENEKLDNKAIMSMAASEWKKYKEDKASSNA